MCKLLLCVLKVWSVWLSRTKEQTSGTDSFIRTKTLDGLAQNAGAPLNGRRLGRASAFPLQPRESPAAAQKSALSMELYGPAVWEESRSQETKGQHTHWWRVHCLNHTSETDRRDLLPLLQSHVQPVRHGCVQWPGKVLLYPPPTPPYITNIDLIQGQRTSLEADEASREDVPHVEIRDFPSSFHFHQQE